MTTLDSLTPATLVKLLTSKGYKVKLDDGTWRTAAAVTEWLAKGEDLLGAVATGPEPRLGHVIPKEWLDSGKPERIIAHWTAGAYLVSELDKEHYHFIIDGDSKLFRGDHSVSDNDLATDGDYAAHTRGCNTKSIGISVACMAGAIESPFKEGRYPMKELQWKMMAQVAAELCIHYKIPVGVRTVLGHGEVQRILGIAQAGKWDPMVLPWQHQIDKSVVGDMFRALVQQYVEQLR